MYPSAESHSSIRHLSLSAPSPNDRNKNDAFLLCVDDSANLTICDARQFSSSSSNNKQEEEQQGEKMHQNQKIKNNSSSTCSTASTLPIVSTLKSLSGSPRAAVWCPFVSQTLEETGDDMHCLLTSCVGCPLHLRYFSHPTTTSTSGGGDGIKKTENENQDEDDENEVHGHDPNWVEGSYAFHDDMDYLLTANCLDWNKSRQTHIVCGFDKGFVALFDVEKPGAKCGGSGNSNVGLVFKCQIGKKFGGATTIPSIGGGSGSGSLGSSLHAVSAVNVNGNKPELIAIGTRNSSDIPILDTRQRLPACCLRTFSPDLLFSSASSVSSSVSNKNNNNNNNQNSNLKSNFNSAGVTQLRFDPLNEMLLYSTSRGSSFCARSGVFQHDLRKATEPVGILARPPPTSSNNNINELTMQPVDFDLVAPSELNRIWDRFYSSSSSSFDGEEEKPKILSQNFSVIVSGSFQPSLTIGQCTPISQLQQKEKEKEGNNVVLSRNSYPSSSSDSSSSSFSSSGGNFFFCAPTTAVSICTKRGILCCGGGSRTFAKNLNLFEDGDDSDEEEDESDGTKKNQNQQQNNKRVETSGTRREREGEQGSARKNKYSGVRSSQKSNNNNQGNKVEKFLRVFRI